MDRIRQCGAYGNAAHRIRRCCILCNAQKYGTAANAVRSKGARGLILLRSLVLGDELVLHITGHQFV